uniref:Geranylgeranyl pyrophosphate synthetase n=1 Tax=Magallana gigas TaxID=29159 RepID=K1QDU6_MAGGI
MYMSMCCDVSCSSTGATGALQLHMPDSREESQDQAISIAHNIYGVPQTINSANYVYFLGLEKVLQLDHPESTKVFTAQLLELHRGQGMDIYWRDAVVCPTEEEYKAMVIKKTGGLFGLAVGLMQLFSDCKKDFVPLLNALGLYFQIRDDYANLYSKEVVYQEISEILNTDQDILRQRTTDNDVKKYCVECLHRLGSFEYTKEILIQLENSIFELIEEHGGNPILTALINELKKVYRGSQ